MTQASQQAFRPGKRLTVARAAADWCNGAAGRCVRVAAMSVLDPLFANRRGAVSAGASHRRRIRIGARFMVCATVALVIAGALSTAGVVAYGQHTTLAGARADRDAADRLVAALLARARADGVEAARLAPVADRERAILAESAVASRFLVLDGGESAHLERQATALRKLAEEIPSVERAAADSARTASTPILDRLDAAVAAASAAGLDVNAQAAWAGAVLEAVGRATTPREVQSAVAGLPATIDQLGAETQAKLAADAAAAAAAALVASRQHAVDALARADRLVAQAQQYPVLQISGWAATISAQHQAFNAAADIAGFDAVTGATRAASAGIDQLLSDRADTYSAMAQARQTVADAQRLNIDPGTLPAQLDSLQPQLDAAGTSPQLVALTGQINDASGPLAIKVAIAELGTGKVILISLSQQTLTAYQDGVKQLTTYVTTGRPALPTPPGVYSVLRKNHPWQMVSDFPPSSPYWYPPSWVQYTLWFRPDGYAIHDAPWRSTYGPGTQQYGSHGCVNVPMPTMSTLYAWADVGTRVIVQ